MCKNKINLIIIACLWACMFFIFNPFDNSAQSNVSIEYGSPSKVIGEITLETVIEQPFIVDNQNGFNGLQLQLATYARTNNGHLYIDIINGEDMSIIYDETIDVSKVDDNSWYSLKFDSSLNEGNYILRIHSDGTSGNAVTIHCGEDEFVNNATINGVDTGLVLNYKIDVSCPYISTIKIVCWVIATVASLVVAFFCKSTDEKNFLMIAITFGILMVFLNPFPHGVDESTHFFRSYMIASGNVLDDVSENGEIGGIVSSNYESIVDKELSINTYFTNSKYWNQSFNEKTSFYENPYMSSVTPFNHAIASVGVFIGKVLNAPAIVVILLGRIANLAFYIAFSYLAIKKAKYYKNIFFMAALLPSIIWLSASYSIEPTLVGSSLLYISICLSYFFEKDKDKVSMIDILLLLVCAAFIVSVKYLIYAPILLLFFLIPKEKFTKNQYKFALIAGVTIVIVLTLIQLKLLGMYNFTEDRNGDVDVKRQIIYMFKNPVTVIRNFLDYAFSNSFNILTSTNVLYSSLKFTKCINILVILSSVIETKKYSFKDNHKTKKLVLYCVLICLVCYSLIIVALYVGFTPVGKFAVEGIQPRYFYPFLPLLMILLSMVNVENRIKDYEYKMVLVSQIGLICLVVDTLIYVFA